MQAMHGLAVLVRARGRLIGCCTAIALAITALAGASSASGALPIKEQYLALGDSLAFGYSTQLYHEGEAAGFVDPEGFEKGYVNQYAKVLKAKAKKVGNGLRVVNDGCPGETTGSLIGTSESIIGTLNAALKKSQEENGLPKIKGESACAYQAAWNAFKKVGTGGPLHHPYSGSQLEDAIDTLYNAAKVEKKPVTTISLNIGANDELKTLGAVEGEAKAFVEAKVAKVAKEAIEAKLAKVAQEAIEAKVNEQVYIKCSEKAFEETGGEEPAFEEARNTCLETEGKELGEQYYAENKEQLEKEGKEAAEKYFAENKAKLEKEGKEAGEKYFAENKFKLGAEGEAFASKKIEELVPGLFAQINSNLAGILLALRSGESLGLKGGKAINYPGRIIFNGQYDPFGKLFHFAYEGVKFVEEHGGLAGPFASIVGRCDPHGATEAEEKEKIEAGCTAWEVHPGFNGLTDILNNATVKTTKGFGACFANPRPLFNTGNQITEPEKLTAFTNMKNFTETKVGETFKVNGPDIHPTPLGYAEIGKLDGKRTNNTCKKEGLPGF